MADKQFLKGAITGVLCVSLVLGGGYVGLQKAGRAGSMYCRMWQLPRRLSIWKIL